MKKNINIIENEFRYQISGNERLYIDIKLNNNERELL